MKTHVHNSILELSPEAWSALAPKNFPFWDYEFLRALEVSGSLGRRTGWYPRIEARYDQDRLVGAAVSFQKTNSYGEYIFDFQWAQAYEHHGGRYYPKRVMAVPFTPATGPRLLGEGNFPHEIAERARAEGDSSVHALFIAEEEIPRFEEAGYLIRHSYQYHYLRPTEDRNFADYLARFKAKRRREIRREREEVAASGVRIERLTGNELTPEHAELMAELYGLTVEKRGGHEYLTPEFFTEIFKTMKDRILFVLARDAQGEPVAGALNFIKGDTLFGRHWGARAAYRSLHFELCYYQGLEYVFEKGLRLFEAGAQGEHKFLRGFLPRLTYSAHRIFDPRFEEAIRDFVVAERNQIAELFDIYRAQSPLNSTSGKFPES